MIMNTRYSINFWPKYPAPAYSGGMNRQLLCYISRKLLFQYPVFRLFFSQISRIPIILYLNIPYRDILIGRHTCCRSNLSLVENVLSHFHCYFSLSRIH